MDKQASSILVIAVVLIASTAGVTWALANNNGDTDSDTDTLFQVSLLQGLMFGDYEGSITIEELKNRGTVGIGTFDGLNGELIMLDGIVYRAAVGPGDTCLVTVVDDSEKVPFANVAKMEADITSTVSSTSLASMQAALTSKISDSPNSFYFATIHATFPAITVRSELAQTEPYEPLVDVLATDQREWTESDMTGTVVALYCPAYMDKVNTPGWHLHFISDDRQFGGHVLNLTVTDATVELNQLTDFVMITPDSDRFQEFDLSVDQSDDIHTVEG